MVSQAAILCTRRAISQNNNTATAAAKRAPVFLRETSRDDAMAKTLSAAQKAAQTRKRRATARMAAVTRNRRAGARQAVITRNVMQWSDICKAYFMLTGKVGFVPFAPISRSRSMLA
jgi:hypothetical protein